MEILIVGGALVALMVYVSTRIKKSAARAYERETVEAEDFRVVKPEGFIIPVVDNSEYAFQARSKEYGDEDEAHLFPKVSIKLKVAADLNFETACRNAQSLVDKITSENFPTGEAANQKACLLEGEKTEDEISFDVFHKIVESRQGKIYDLKISVLRENREQFGEQIRDTINGFQVK